MKTLIPYFAAALGLLVAAPSGGAWTYSDGDVLLIFRDGVHDVEFDLGSVNQFLGRANGTSWVVSNWNVALVTNTFGADLTASGAGVKVLLVAATAPSSPNSTAWLTGAEPNTTAYSPSPSGWGNLYGTINSIGISPPIYNVPTNSTSQSYVIGAIGSGSVGRYKYASYDYIVSGGTYNNISTLGGNAGFTVEQSIPGTLEFWGVQSTAALPTPPDTLLGTFTISADGSLTFTAGPPPSTILGIRSAGGTNTVSFTTEVGGNYWLAYTNVLNAAAATWPLVSGPLAGDGNNNSLAHTAATPAGFYRVVRAP